MSCGYRGTKELESLCIQRVRVIELGTEIRFTGRVVDIAVPKQPETLCGPKVSEPPDVHMRHRHDRCGYPTSRRLETL